MEIEPMGYELWQNEVHNPQPIERRADRATEPADMLGFWRIESARTKTDWPVAIFQQDGEHGPVFFVIGSGEYNGRSKFNTAGHPERVAEFCESTWLKCIAVEEDVYHAAMRSKLWPDGKEAIRMTDDERLDIIPSTPPGEGGNAPVGDDGEPVDEYHQQIVAKIEALIEKAKPFAKIKTLDEANAAAEVLEPLRKLGSKGEARRKEEKQPHLDAGAAVDAKWAVIRDASAVVKSLVDAIDAFKRAEQARLQREERERQEAERKRLAEIEAERLRKEAEAEAAAAAARGEEAETIDEDAIAAQAEQAAAEQVEETAVPVEAPRVGTKHGRAVTKAKRKRAEVTDFLVLATSLLEAGDSELKAYLQKRADAAARAKITLAGTEIVEE